tara:strand:+ start:51927 stop:53435 length:1509 start_codon:yes stop_codon:yes gene_type:complete
LGIVIIKYKIFENINLAKSILRKKGLDTTDENYIEILRIADNKKGWIGFLCKLFFEYHVDILETEHIFNVLIDKKVDLGKVIKLNYNQLSDYLYDLEKNSSSDTDYKFIYNDGTYMYFEVFTYEGILDISSPAWCLKTKKHYIHYTKDGGRQFVIIKKGKKLLTPNTNYLSNYSNSGSADVRYGITLQPNNKYVIFDDNNGSLTKDSNFLIKKIFNNVLNYSKGEKMGNWEIIESDDLIKVHTSKKGTKGYYISNRKAYDNYNKQFPFGDLKSIEHIIDENHKQNYLIMGFNNKKIQQAFVITDYVFKLFSDKEYSGYTDMSFTEDSTQRDIIDAIYKKGLIKSRKIPLMVVPILVELGHKNYDTICEENPDNMYQDDTYLYRIYTTSAKKIVIQQISKKLNLLSMNTIFLFYSGEPYSTWNNPNEITDQKNQIVKTATWKKMENSNRNIIKEMFNNYLPIHIKDKEDDIRKKEQRKRNAEEIKRKKREQERKDKPWWKKII